MSVLVQIIQQEAKKRCVTPMMLSKKTGIAYSRAHGLLSAGERRGTDNIEKALQELCPELWAQICRAVDEGSG